MDPVKKSQLASNWGECLSNIQQNANRKFIALQSSSKDDFYVTSDHDKKLSLSKICSISKHVIEERQMMRSTEGSNAAEEVGKIRDLTKALIQQKEDRRNEPWGMIGRIAISVVSILGVITIPICLWMIADEIRFRMQIAAMKEKIGPTELEKLGKEIFADDSQEIKDLKALAAIKWTAETFENQLTENLKIKKPLKDEEIEGEEQKRFFAERNPDTPVVMVEQFYMDVVQREISFNLIDNGLKFEPDDINQEFSDARSLLNAAKQHLKEMEAEGDPKKIEAAQKDVVRAQSKCRKAEAAKVIHHVSAIDMAAAGDEQWQSAMQTLCTQTNMNDLFGAEILQMQILSAGGSRIDQKIESFKEQHGIPIDFRMDVELAQPKITLKIERDETDKSIKKINVVCEGHLDIITRNNEGKLATLVENVMAKRLSYSVTLTEDGHMLVSDYHKEVL